MTSVDLTIASASVGRDAAQLATSAGSAPNIPGNPSTARFVGNPTLPADERTPDRWFNTGAFAASPQFTLGSASRNPVRGPSYRNVDLALIRRIPVGSGPSIELRAEVVNLVNTPPLGAPAGVYGAANFGTITSAGVPASFNSH